MLRKKKCKMQKILLYSYGPPSYPPQEPPPPYGMPHALIGGILSELLEKLKFKINLFTFGKLLLKLVLFKKLVSFIAVICLLLFIPWLKNVKGDDKSFGEEYRKVSHDGECK